MLTATQLREVLDYKPETGIFRWKIKPKTTVEIGAVAGFIVGGLVKIGVRGRAYRAHRLAVLWMTGEWPEDQVDHKDRNPLNNRWSNLRQATSSQNLANKVVRKDSQSGLKGVYFDRRRSKYKAHIGFAGKQIFLGYYDSPEVAHRRYVKAAVDLNGEYAGH